MTVQALRRRVVAALLAGLVIALAPAVETSATPTPAAPAAPSLPAVVLSGS